MATYGDISRFSEGKVTSDCFFIHRPSLWNRCMWMMSTGGRRQMSSRLVAATPLLHLGHVQSLMVSLAMNSLMHSCSEHWLELAGMGTERRKNTSYLTGCHRMRSIAWT